MHFKITTRGNGITNSRIHTYKNTQTYDPEKLKKYLVERRGVQISVFMFKLEPTDTNVKLIWEGGT